LRHVFGYQGFPRLTANALLASAGELISKRSPGVAPICSPQYPATLIDRRMACLRITESFDSFLPCPQPEYFGARSPSS
jgi:hypothetical protein